MTTRIGGADDPEHALTTIGNIAIGPDEEIFLSEPQSGSIQVFDVNGHRVRSIGNQGEGPGEFGWVSFINVMADTLYATDDALGRGTYFSTTGDLIKTAPLHVEGRSGPQWQGSGVAYMRTAPQIVLADGTALAEVLASVLYRGDATRSEPLWSFGPWQVPFVHIDSRGQVLDTIARLENHWLRFGVRNDERTEYFVPPFTDRPLGTLLRDGRGVVLVDRSVSTRGSRAAFTVTIIDASGDTASAAVLSYSPVPISDDVVDRAVRMLHTVRGYTPDPSAAARVLRDQGLVPPFLPPVSALSVGQDGSIWLRREDLRTDSILWNVIDAEGSVRGRIVLPRSDSVVAARGDLIVTTARDELDVPLMTVYRVRR